ncbi:MAG: hypothetical protein ABWW69_00340, partial [Pyrodictiaceae archaeon]
LDEKSMEQLYAKDVDVIEGCPSNAKGLVGYGLKLTLSTSIGKCPLAHKSIDFRIPASIVNSFLRAILGGIDLTHATSPVVITTTCGRGCLKLDIRALWLSGLSRLLRLSAHRELLGLLGVRGVGLKDYHRLAVLTATIPLPALTGFMAKHACSQSI